ncbi:hypothetical protein HGRIS_001883 [Hohenbuehelia grisea]|uniref:Peptidase S28 n=1 Tax=Hohenbuehelia grisea TaxID=104357 RepID=A0ABR3JJE3_9AGAR
MVSPRQWKLAVVLASLSSLAHAALPDGRFNGNIMPHPAIPPVEVPEGLPVVSRNGTQLPPYNQTYIFDQLIDHNNPSLGTFKQRFWHTYEFYEPGGPIILMTPGEANAQPYSGYLTNRTINGLIAQQQNGSAIVLEHRFYGLSNPKPDLSAESLKLHTIQQAIDDLEYFAKNVKLPQPDGDKVAPGQAPWILIGGSYSGALTSFTMVNKPNLFHAGYASSAVVESILDFWRYFEPVRQNMPRNCSADVQAVIAHIDTVFKGNNATAIQAIKDNFGLGIVTHLDDVAGALRNNLWDWQSLQVTSGPNTTFTRFCDSLEVKNGVSAPASGWGVETALPAWGNFWKSGYLRNVCGKQNAEDCLGSYNVTQDYWTNTTVDNANRSWFWIVCNEVGFLQEGAPTGQPSLVTRLVQPAYDLRQCQQMFPAAFPKPPNVNVARTNAAYKGWNVKINRLFFANGLRDPWREATMSAQSITVNVKSTSQQPIAMGDGFHCTDLSAGSAVDATVNAVQQKALASMKTWLTQWKPTSTHAGPKGNSPQIDSRPSFGRNSREKPVNAWFRPSSSFNGA